MSGLEFLALITVVFICATIAALIFEGSKVKKESRENPRQLWKGEITEDAGGTVWDHAGHALYHKDRGTSLSREPVALKCTDPIRTKVKRDPSSLEYPSEEWSERKKSGKVPPSEKPSELKVLFKSTRAKSRAEEKPITTKKRLIISEEQRAALAIQEDLIKRQYEGDTESPRSIEGLTYGEWVHAACAALQAIWWGEKPTYIREMILGEMEIAGMKFPDPEYEWSYGAAKEFAKEIHSNYGEAYGSNT